MADEIDPCPFCRGVATVSCLPEEGTPRVFCNDCFCWGSDAQTEAEAIAAWNKRAPEPAAAPYTDNRPHKDWCSLKNIEYGFASCGCLHPDAVPPDAATPGDEAMEVWQSIYQAWTHADVTRPVGHEAAAAVIQRLIDQRDAAFRAGQVDMQARAAGVVSGGMYNEYGRPQPGIVAAILSLPVKDANDE